jgi:hypothetical protein
LKDYAYGKLLLNEVVQREVLQASSATTTISSRINLSKAIEALKGLREDWKSKRYLFVARHLPYGR